ncbi:alpha/beta-hydrolase [Tricholoma matsutake]|nr:alpha/beta-hydrolase [Tricholoma matsutake 945]
MPSKGHLTTRLVRRVHIVLASIGLFYGLVVVLVMTPFIQKSVLYATHIYSSGYNSFDHPENYGLAPGKTVNLKLRSSDNTTIGAWYVFSNKFYRNLPFPPSNTPQKNLIPVATRNNPTILFLHGNSGTRATPLRTALYTSYTSRLNSNVLAIDYRGFGDSEGLPTEDGVTLDARAGWDYLIKQGARAEDIIIVGHSLGTAVAGLLTAGLGRENIVPRGLVFMSPFTSVRRLVDEYYLFGLFPLLKPLRLIPLASDVITWSLVHKYDTLRLVPEIKTSILIAHAENDWDIPHSHSSTLFDAFLDPLLLESPTAAGLMNISDLDAISVQLALQNARRAELVSRVSIHNFGTLDEFAADGRKVALLKTISGKHDIPKDEGVQDTIGRMFDLY